MEHTLFDKNRTAALIAVLLVLFLGLFLRTWNLDVNPPAPFADELVNFCGARSVWETGRDLDGKSLFYLSDRVELRTPLYGTLAYFSTRFCGENNFGIRLPAALMGTITLLLAYLLVLQLTAKRLPALLAAFCLAVLPWHIHLSRIGWEPAALLFFLLLTLLLFTKGIKQNKQPVLLAGFLCCGLTVYTYAGAPLYAFLFLVFLVAVNYRYFIKHKVCFAVGCLLAGLAVVPYCIVALTQPALLARAARINTFAGGVNFKTLSLFFTNYFAHFNPDYLFVKGDGNIRLSAPRGVLCWWMLPFIICGLVGAWKWVKPHPFFWLLLFWLLIFPFGGSFTNDGVPHSNRTLPGAPLFALLTGMGIFYVIYLIHDFISRIKKVPFMQEGMALLFVCVISLSFIPFADYYFRTYPEESSAAWNYGQDEVFSTVKAIAGNYKNIFFGNLDYWIKIPMLAFYFPGQNLYIIEADEPYLWYDKPGTIFVLPEHMHKPEKYRLIKIIYDMHGVPLYSVLVIEEAHITG